MNRDGRSRRRRSGSSSRSLVRQSTGHVVARDVQPAARGSQRGPLLCVEEIIALYHDWRLRLITSTGGLGYPVVRVWSALIEERVVYSVAARVLKEEGLKLLFRW